MQLPTAEEEEATADATQRALSSLLDGKIKKAKPSSGASLPTEEEEPKYIRYTPNPNAPGYNPAAQQRVIRMVEAQVDPLEPPKHKIKKVPRGGGSPPVPVLHSPPRNLTVKDQQAWKIPPCISNWKNARGYTIPLDKRLAADGRGLQEVTINNKFASFSESLYIAERKAAEDLRVRNQIRKKMAMREKEDREKELRELASKARMERAGVLGGGEDDRQPDDEPASYYQRSRPDSDHEEDVERRGRLASRGNSRSSSRSRSNSRSRSRSSSRGRRGRGGRSGSRDRSRSPVRGRHSRRNSRSDDEWEGGGRRRGSRDEFGRDDRDRGGGRDDGDRDMDRRDRGETEEERVARMQREKLRIERRKEREREIRLENMKVTEPYL